MKINPSSALASFSWLAWGIAAIVAVTELSGTKVVVLAVGAGATLTICAVALHCTTKIITTFVATTEEHAQRMERATAEHAELLSKHVLALDRFFGMGVRSDVLTKVHIAESRSMNGHGTGPFRVYDGTAS